MFKELEEAKAESKERHAKGKAKADLAIAKDKNAKTRYALRLLVNAKSDIIVIA